MIRLNVTSNEAIVTKIRTEDKTLNRVFLLYWIIESKILPWTCEEARGGEIIFGLYPVVKGFTLMKNQNIVNLSS